MGRWISSGLWRGNDQVDDFCKRCTEADELHSVQVGPTCRCQNSESLRVIIRNPNKKTYGGTSLPPAFNNMGGGRPCRWGGEIPVRALNKSYCLIWPYYCFYKLHQRTSYHPIHRFILEVGARLGFVPGWGCRVSLKPPWDRFGTRLGCELA